VMGSVKRYCMDPSVTNNSKDPLFLNFRIQSQATKLYDDMATILQSLFGTGNVNGNVIFMPPNKTMLEETTLDKLKQKVVIMVDTTGLVGFESSRLNGITALKFGTLTNKIYRQSDALDAAMHDINFKDNNTKNLQMVIPDLSHSANNYDFVTTAINTGIQFIGMCFQNKDTYLEQYNGGGTNTTTVYFDKFAIISISSTQKPVS
jgi:hypothetical protein